MTSSDNDDGIRSRGDDNGRLPLVAGNENNKNNNLVRKGSKKGFRWWFVPVGLFVVVVLYLLAFHSAETQDLAATLSKSTQCRKICSEAQKRLQQFRIANTQDSRKSLLSVNDMLTTIREGKNAIVEQLKTNYSDEYYKRLFEDSDAPQIDGETLSKGFSLFNSANTPPENKENKVFEELSRHRFQRKLMMKLLEVQINLRKSISGGSLQGCDCTAPSSWKNESSSRRFLGIVRSHVDDAKYFSKFVWSTGGHSAAAAHGNYFEESYTAVMEKVLHPILSELGIDFEGRNYAIGATQSAPDMALCVEAVYGLDADVISWDFGMTDNRFHWKKALYNYRIANHPNRPAMVDLNVNGPNFYGWNMVSKIMENMGMTAFYMKVVKEGPNLDGFLKENLPDMFGLTQEQIDAYPPYVRNFRCQDKLEDGDPTCRDEKYTNTYMNNETTKHWCDNTKHRAPWHPGWRVNALYGNWMSLFFMDHLLLAAKQLIRDMTNITQYLDENTVLGKEQIIYNRLLKEEDEDYRMFQEKAADILVNDTDMQARLSSLDPEIKGHVKEIYTSTPVICHTAMLPAETRYLGHMMNHNENDQLYTAETYTTSFEGVSRSEIDSNNNSVVVAGVAAGVPDMLLVRTDFPHHEKCPVTVLVDFKDYFYANDKMGWTKIVTPNPREMDAYLKTKDGKKAALKGIVVVCLVLCDWGRCPEGDTRVEHYGDGLQIKVNGKDVVKMLPFGEFCSLLEGAGGSISFGTDLPYQMEVKVFPNATQGYSNYIRISSVIIL